MQLIPFHQLQGGWPEQSVTSSYHWFACPTKSGSYGPRHKDNNMAATKMNRENSGGAQRANDNGELADYQRIFVFDPSPRVDCSVPGCIGHAAWPALLYHLAPSFASSDWTDVMLLCFLLLLSSPALGHAFCARVFGRPAGSDVTVSSHDQISNMG